MNENLKNCGFMYCIYSDDGKVNNYFTDEFLKSLKSLKKISSKLPVSLYTNIIFENIYGIDNVIYDKDIDKRLICKAKALLKSPYEKTIFLDTDTLIYRRIILDIFKVLDEFEFTCCHGNAPPHKGGIYPDLNTGLLGVNNNDFTREQINKWIKAYVSCNDQLSFREVVFMNNKNKFYILPPYFMMRSYHYIDYPGHAVLIHDHDISKPEPKKKVISKILETWNKKYLNT